MYWDQPAIQVDYSPGFPDFPHGFYGETTTAPKAFTTSREATNLCRSEAGTTWDKPLLGWLDMTMGTISQKDLMGTEWECNGIYI